MHKLYWKIFLSFWLITILTIVTAAWVTNQVAHNTTAPVNEKFFLDNYANAAVATFESGHHEAFNRWIKYIGFNKKVRIFLLNKNGEVFGMEPIPDIVKTVSQKWKDKKFGNKVFRGRDYLLSTNIIANNGAEYRMMLYFSSPLQSLWNISKRTLATRLVFAMLFSGVICFFLSKYLTKPLISLGYAAKDIASGHLHTRVENTARMRNDEIGELAEEFNLMAENLEQMSSSKQRLIQDISHELRSPLARLHIALEIARKKTQDMASAELDRIELETERLNELIGEMLDLAKMDELRVKLNREDHSLRTILEDIAEDANFEFAKDTPRVIVPDTADIQLTVDRKLLHRAIENIVRNALRYSEPETTVELNLAYADDGKQVVIEVKDRGPGVPEEELEKIFEPFHRVDTSREKKTGGYGLGLAIAMQALHLHGGQITAKNREQGGLKVILSLPAHTRHHWSCHLKVSV